MRSARELRSFDGEADFAGRDDWDFWREASWAG